MNISRSKLRKLIREALETAMLTKLRVLDFDDTIAHTGEKVKLYTPATDENPDGYKMLTSDEYAVYEPQEGEYYDESSFEEFSQVNVDLATPVDVVFKILRRFVNAKEGQRIILILTARKQVVEPFVRKFLEKEGLDHTSIRFEGVGSSDPVEKVNAIDRYIKTNDIGFVSFWDDSIKNVCAVRAYLQGLPIEMDVAHIKSEGDKTTLDRYFLCEEY